MWVWTPSNISGRRQGGRMGVPGAVRATAQAEGLSSEGKHTIP